MINNARKYEVVAEMINILNEKSDGVYNKDKTMGYAGSAALGTVLGLPIIGTGLGAGAYAVYRHLRQKGSSKSSAAFRAAEAAHKKGDTKKADEWYRKAKKYKAKGE